MINIKYFLNDKMKLLIVIKEHQINVAGITMCPMNQQEMADAVGCSKSTLNKMMRELVREGYVRVHKRGKYILTKESQDVINRLDLIKE